MLTLMLYMLFWYPITVSFVFNQEIPRKLIAFEIAKFALFLFDILINIWTTYLNDNNEEIVDPKMLRQAYMKSPRFIIDIVTTLPISELLLLILTKHDKRFAVYSLFKLVGLLRIIKIDYYYNNIRIPILLKVLWTFGIFFLLVGLFPSSSYINRHTGYHASGIS